MGFEVGNPQRRRFSISGFVIYYALMEITAMLFDAEGPQKMSFLVSTLDFCCHLKVKLGIEIV